MQYPNRTAVIEALLDAASAAANRCESDHPDDIAIAMSAAIEGAAPAVLTFWRRIAS